MIVVVETKDNISLYFCAKKVEYELKSKNDKHLIIFFKDGASQKIPWQKIEHIDEMDENDLILQPKGLSWWIETADIRKHDFHFTSQELRKMLDNQAIWAEKKEKKANYFITVQNALKEKMPLKDMLIGHCIAKPWSWFDQHSFWGEKDRVEAIQKSYSNYPTKVLLHGTESQD